MSAALGRAQAGSSQPMQARWGGLQACRLWQALRCGHISAVPPGAVAQPRPLLQPPMSALLRFPLGLREFPFDPTLSC